MSERPDLPLTTPEVPNSGAPPVPSTINMPDHEVRQSKMYQLYVRLARPTLDWITNAAVLWTMIVQPRFEHKFDIVAAGLSLTWAAAVYGIKTYEKTKGVA